MRKLTLILLSILLVTALFVSCKVEMNDADGELVSLRFSTDDDARALTSSRNDFKNTDYTWYYTATKKDKLPKYGETSVEKLVGEEGKLSEVAGSFSPGAWEFTLCGYSKTNSSMLVYEGTTLFTLGNSKKYSVAVSVEPQMTSNGKGTLVISNDIVLKDNNSFGPNKVTISKIEDGSRRIYNNYNNADITSGLTLNDVPSGLYLLELSYKSTHTYAVNTIAVNVWNGLTTKIEGELDLTTTNVTFSAEGEGSTGVVLTASNGLKADEKGIYTYYITPYNYEDSVATSSYTSSYEGDKYKTTITGTFNYTGDDKSLTLTTYDKTAATASFSNNNNIAAFEIKTDGTLVNGISVASYIEPGHSDVIISYFELDENGSNKETRLSSSDVTYDGNTGKLTFKYSTVGKFVVKPAVVTLTTSSDASGTKYATLGEAISTVEEGTDGNKITLNEDIEQSDKLTIVSGKKLTLDLGEHEISSKLNTESNSALFDVQGELTIKNGTIEVERGNTEKSCANLFYVNNANSTTGETSQAKLTIEGGTYTADGTVITGSGNDGGSNTSTPDATNITITGGTFTSTTGTAIYHPQNGTLTITNGTFTGGTSGSAVEIRAGQATISGGTFNSTAEYKVEDNSSGTTVTGAALAVSQHTTEVAKSMAVTIDGGTFKSTGTGGKQIAFVYTLDAEGTNNTATLKIKNELITSDTTSITSIVGTRGTQESTHTSYTAKVMQSQ